MARLRSDGARGGLFGGLMMTLVAAIFIFDLNWQIMWPVGMILAGIGIILNGAGRRRNKEKTVEDLY